MTTPEPVDLGKEPEGPEPTTVKAADGPRDWAPRNQRCNRNGGGYRPAHYIWTYLLLWVLFIWFILPLLFVNNYHHIQHFRGGRY